MTLPDPKELEKLLKVCRKQGVMELSFGVLSVKLGDLPRKAASSEEVSEIESDGLSDEELMFAHIREGL